MANVFLSNYLNVFFNGLIGNQNDLHYSSRLTLAVISPDYPGSLWFSRDLKLSLQAHGLGLLTQI